MTAPVGAMIIQPLGEKWLSRDHKGEEEQPHPGGESFIKRDEDFMGMQPSHDNEIDLEELGGSIDGRNMSISMLNPMGKGVKDSARTPEKSAGGSSSNSPNVH